MPAESRYWRQASMRSPARYVATIRSVSSYPGPVGQQGRERRLVHDHDAHDGRVPLQQSERAHRTAAGAEQTRRATVDVGDEGRHIVGARVG